MSDSEQESALIGAGWTRIEGERFRSPGGAIVVHRLDLTERKSGDELILSLGRHTTSNEIHAAAGSIPNTATLTDISEAYTTVRTIVRRLSVRSLSFPQVRLRRVLLTANSSDFIAETPSTLRLCATEMSRAIHKHINLPSVREYPGVFRGRRVTHFIAPHTRLCVVLGHDGAIEAAFKVSPTQLQSIMGQSQPRVPSNIEAREDSNADFPHGGFESVYAWIIEATRMLLEATDAEHAIRDLLQTVAHLNKIAPLERLR